MADADSVRQARIQKAIDEMQATIAKLHDQLLAVQRIAGSQNPIGEAMGLYQRLWREKFKADYLFNRKADPADLKRRINSCGADDVKRRIVAYFADDDPFLVKQHYPYNLFSSRFNLYAGNGTPEDSEAPFLASAAVGCRHQPKCQSDVEHTKKRALEMRA